jgi:hypothetical protein
MYLQGEGKIVEHKLNGKKSEVNIPLKLSRHGSVITDRAVARIRDGYKLLLASQRAPKIFQNAYFQPLT